MDWQTEAARRKASADPLFLGGGIFKRQRGGDEA